MKTSVTFSSHLKMISPLGICSILGLFMFRLMHCFFIVHFPTKPYVSSFSKFPLF